MLVLGVGGYKVIQGDLTIGMLVAFQILMASFLRPIGNLVQLGQTIQELQGDLGRLDDVLAHEVDPIEKDPEPGTPVSGPSRLVVTRSCACAGSCSSETSPLATTRRRRR